MASAAHPEIPYSGLRIHAQPAHRFSETGEMPIKPSKAQQKR
jgi:hypothetical protein